MKKQKRLQAGSPRGEAGQTLLEILLAFSVSILVLSAIVIGVTTSLSNTQYTKNQNLANSYAKEGMAVVRKIRDSGWSTFSSYTSNTIYCIEPDLDLISLNLPNQNCWAQSPVPVGGIFSREVRFFHYKDDNTMSNRCAAGTPTPPPAGTGGSKVIVTVSWSDSKCPVGTPRCHKVELISCFSNLDQKQAP